MDAHATDEWKKTKSEKKQKGRTTEKKFKPVIYEKHGKQQELPEIRVEKPFIGMPDKKKALPLHRKGMNQKVNHLKSI